MNFQEYINQVNPVRNPDVVLTPDDYTEITVHGPNRLVEIKHFDIYYVIPEGKTRLWTRDDNGNKKEPSCFRLQTGFGDSLREREIIKTN